MNEKTTIGYKIFTKRGKDSHGTYYGYSSMGKGTIKIRLNKWVDWVKHDGILVCFKSIHDVERYIKYDVDDRNGVFVLKCEICDPEEHQVIMGNFTVMVWHSKKIRPIEEVTI